MAEVLIPPGIVPSEETVEIVDDSTAVFRPLFGGGLVQRVQQASPRIRVTQKWRSLREEDRARMLAVCAAAQGKFKALRAVVGYANQGTFPNSEMVYDPSFMLGQTNSWTPTRCEFQIRSNVARLKCDGTSGTVQAQTVPYRATVASVAYAARTILHHSFVTHVNTSFVGGMLNGAMVGSKSLQDGQYGVSVVVSSGANYAFAARLGVADFDTWEYMDMPWASMNCCLLASTNYAAGTNKISTAGGVPGLVAPIANGSLIEINGELKIILSADDFNGAGQGYLVFTPPLIAAASSGAPVIINQPMGKFILADNPRWTNQFGVYADLELTFEHIYEP